MKHNKLNREAGAISPVNASPGAKAGQYTGGNEMKTRPELSREDWAEIYYALDYKLGSPAVAGDREWEGHLENIMDTIGEDGLNMIDDEYRIEQREVL